MARTTAIGVQDFGALIENDYFYVDKTASLTLETGLPDRSQSGSIADPQIWIRV